MFLLKIETTVIYLIAQPLKLRYVIFCYTLDTFLFSLTDELLKLQYVTFLLTLLNSFTSHSVPARLMLSIIKIYFAKNELFTETVIAYDSWVLHRYPGGRFPGILTKAEEEV